MAPSRPPASQPTARGRPSHTEDANGERYVSQAGRTSATIAAQASAQSLREASRDDSRSSSRTSPAGPNLLRKSRPPSQTHHHPIPESSRAPPAAAVTPRQAAPHEPAVSASSHGVPSTTSSSTSASRTNSNEGAGRTSAGSSSSSGRTKAAAALATQMAAADASTTSVATARLPLLRAPPEMSQADSSPSLTRQPTPRSVHDLGADYSRYYNPFASANNSQQDLSTASLPRYNSSTPLMAGTAAGVSSSDLHQRLSDPFHDTKRLSDPFATRAQPSPSTPRLNPPAGPSEREKMATAAAAAVPVAPARADTPNIIYEGDPEKAGFYPYMDDRLGAPGYAFPLFTDEREDDDDMHMPQWDDDVRLKPSLKDHFSKGNIINTLGMIFMTLGLLCVFVVLPVISYTGTSLLYYMYETPMDQMPGKAPPKEAWATVNNATYPLLQNLRTGLIDPDTPESAKTRKGVNGDEYVLVFSDEFNAKNRSFYPGDDPYWFGLDGWYGATQDLEWYDPDAINTGDGTLQLQLDKFMNHGLNYRSGMLNSWNQICFKGGIFEVSVSLPGPAGVHSWWPGAWTMGNLGRPGYLATSDGLWPYTYNDCDVGITPNQSSHDGISNLPGQRLPSCTCNGEDHPSPGVGRGAPEIDIVEVSADWAGKGWGVATQSFQVAPFDVWWYPNYEFMEIPNYNFSFVNTYTGGPYQQAVSTTSMLNNDWYDGKEYQQYAYEYAPGVDENAYIAWIIGNEEMMKFDARAVGPNGNIGQRLISEEPMSMVLNLGFSKNWVDIDFANLVFPSVMRIDYVRWYQKEGNEMVTCDPPGYETTEYIKNHPEAYNNPNHTKWTEAGYDWPKNTFMDGCSA